MRCCPEARNDSLEMWRDSWTNKKERQTQSVRAAPRDHHELHSHAKRDVCPLSKCYSCKEVFHFKFTTWTTNVCVLLALHSVYTLIAHTFVLVGIGDHLFSGKGVEMLTSQRRQEIFCFCFSHSCTCPFREQQKYIFLSSVLYEHNVFIKF